MHELRGALRRVGLEAEYSFIDIPDPAIVEPPIVLHLQRPEHFVVVDSVRDGQWHVLDNEGRRLSVTGAELSRRWSGHTLAVRRKDEAIPLPVFQKRPTTGVACLQFATLRVNLGQIQPSGETLTVRFPFTNLGTEILTIDDVKRSCRCLDVRVLPEKVARNATGTIEIDIVAENTGGAVEAFEHDIVVSSNDPKLPSTPLIITGEFADDSGPFPATMRFGSVVLGRRNTVRYPIAEDVKVTSVKSSFRNSEVEFRIEEGLNMAAEWWPQHQSVSGVSCRRSNDCGTGKVTITPNCERPGTFSESIMFSTERGNDFVVRAVGRIVAPVTLSPKTVVFPCTVESCDGFVRKRLKVLPQPFETCAVVGVVPKAKGIRFEYSKDRFEEVKSVVVCGSLAEIGQAADQTFHVLVRVSGCRRVCRMPLQLVVEGDGD